MVSLKKINKQAATTDKTGFGTNGNIAAGRFYRKDGSVNKEISGINIFERISIYHFLIRLPWISFLLLIVSVFILMNILFTGLYLLVGVEHLQGIIAGEALHVFSEVLFFSVQTFTTVGYGRINPVGTLTSAVAAFEAMTGLLSFALATGLMYGRFSMPKAFLKYSKHALISPYKEGKAIMFRMVPFKDNHLSEAEVKVTLAIKVLENGAKVNKFFPMKLEISNINSLALSWTIVHAINEHSPFHTLTKEDLVNDEAEILIFLKAFDETFSNYVISRTSYTASEFIFGAKFTPMYRASEDKSKTILQIDQLDDYVAAEI